MFLEPTQAGLNGYTAQSFEHPAAQMSSFGNEAVRVLSAASPGLGGMDRCFGKLHSIYNEL